MESQVRLKLWPPFSEETADPYFTIYGQPNPYESFPYHWDPLGEVKMRYGVSKTGESLGKVRLFVRRYLSKSISQCLFSSLRSSLAISVPSGNLWFLKLPHSEEESMLPSKLRSKIMTRAVSTIWYDKKSLDLLT